MLVCCSLFAWVCKSFGSLASSIINWEVFLLLNYRIQQICSLLCTFFSTQQRDCWATQFTQDSPQSQWLWANCSTSAVLEVSCARYGHLQFKIIGKCSKRMAKYCKINGCSLSGFSLSICILFLYSENMVRGLDEDETNFLDEVSRQQELLEKQRREEELKELNEYRISFALKCLTVT